jgi:hypothetical protein
MKTLATGTCLIAFSALAGADLAQWQAAVAVGTAPDYMDVNIVIPVVKNIGTMSGTQGLTYEFCINASNDGLSSALLGAKNTGAGNEAALKFEQYADTMQFGTTQWGIADYFMAPNTPDVDAHVVFVSDTVNNSVELFVNGVSVASAPFAPWITDVVGIGEWYDPGVSVDPLTATMHGLAIYDTMLSPAEILEHANAFLSVGLGTNYCATAANSAGAGAVISAMGTSSIAANDLVLDSGPMAPFEPGIFYYGPDQIQVPFGDGNRCIGGSAGSIVRVFPFAQADGSGNLQLAFDNTGPSHVQVVPGATLNFQAWFRDPAAGMTGFNLSDGLEVTFTP